MLDSYEIIIHQVSGHSAGQSVAEMTGDGGFSCSSVTVVVKSTYVAEYVVVSSDHILMSLVDGTEKATSGAKVSSHILPQL